MDQHEWISMIQCRTRGGHEGTRASERLLTPPHCRHSSEASITRAIATGTLFPGKQSELLYSIAYRTSKHSVKVKLNLQSGIVVWWYEVHPTRAIEKVTNEFTNSMRNARQ